PVAAPAGDDPCRRHPSRRSPGYAPGLPVRFAGPPLARGDGKGNGPPPLLRRPRASGDPTQPPVPSPGSRVEQAPRAGGPSAPRPARRPPFSASGGSRRNVGRAQRGGKRDAHAPL